MVGQRKGAAGRGSRLRTRSPRRSAATRRHGADKGGATKKGKSVSQQQAQPLSFLTQPPGLMHSAIGPSVSSGCPPCCGAAAASSSSVGGLLPGVFFCLLTSFVDSSSFKRRISLTWNSFICPTEKQVQMKRAMAALPCTIMTSAPRSSVQRITRQLTSATQPPQRPKNERNVLIFGGTGPPNSPPSHFLRKCSNMSATQHTTQNVSTLKPRFLDSTTKAAPSTCDAISGYMASQSAVRPVIIQ
mmetsp:Transcript_144733/g.376601  ORF Transcript_144733/g.376601 Transcript_144733/m.376601 type:complete len:244 (+) Transcript_144733:80-811(+)